MHDMVKYTTRGRRGVGEGQGSEGDWHPSTKKFGRDRELEWQRSGRLYLSSSEIKADVSKEILISTGCK